MARNDHRSDEAKAYRRLYKTARWQRLRDSVLREQPLCERCLRMELVEPATVVHHKDGGHKGDETKFWAGPFEALCKPCHDRFGAMEDRGAEVVEFGPDGWPLAWGGIRKVSDASCAGPTRDESAHDFNSNVEGRLWLGRGHRRPRPR